MNQPPNHTLDRQPHPLTFFLTVAERREVLRALRTRDADRRTALLRALNLKPTEPSNDR